MGLFSRSSERRRYRDAHRGSNYYKREGFFSKLFRMFGSFSNSRRRYSSRYSRDSRENHYPDERWRRKRYKSSWS